MSPIQKHLCNVLISNQNYDLNEQKKKTLISWFGSKTVILNPKYDRFHDFNPNEDFINTSWTKNYDFNPE